MTQKLVVRGDPDFPRLGSAEQEEFEVDEAEPLELSTPRIR